MTHDPVSYREKVKRAKDESDLEDQKGQIEKNYATIWKAKALIVGVKLEEYENSFDQFMQALYSGFQDLMITTQLFLSEKAPELEEQIDEIGENTTKLQKQYDQAVTMDVNPNLLRLSKTGIKMLEDGVASGHELIDAMKNLAISARETSNLFMRIIMQLAWSEVRVGTRRVRFKHARYRSQQRLWKIVKILLLVLEFLTFFFLLGFAFDIRREALVEAIVQTPALVLLVLFLSGALVWLLDKFVLGPLYDRFRLWQLKGVVIELIEQAEKLDEAYDQLIIVIAVMTAAVT